MCCNLSKSGQVLDDGNISLYLFYPISSIGPIKILYISQVMSCLSPKLLIKDEVSCQSRSNIGVERSAREEEWSRNMT